MDVFTIISVVLGLALFEIITSIDNAIINADVLRTMKPKNRKWFLGAGIIIGVFVVRGLLPWILVWVSSQKVGAWGALVASFSGDPSIMQAIESSSPILLIGGGTYLLFLFFHWWFIEPKNYGLIGEKKIENFGIWFFAVVSILLAEIVWFALHKQTMMAFGAVLGSTAFFITQGFKTNAEEQEKSLKRKRLSDVSKLFYLEVIDATFSIDSVLGAFAFTLSVPLILLGNGLGALVVREFTIKGTDKIKKYAYLKNGAMYSILFLGIIMLLDSFGYYIPSWISPLITFIIVGYFFIKSKRVMKNKKLPDFS